MSAEQVAVIPRCAESLDVWLPDDGDRWRAYFDTDDELIFYCPDCAQTGSLDTSAPSLLVPACKSVRPIRYGHCGSRWP